MTTVQPNLTRANLTRANFNQIIAYFLEGELPDPKVRLSDRDMKFLINLKGCYNCGETIYPYIPPLDNPHVIVCTSCFEGLFETGYICQICNKSTLNVGFDCVPGVCKSLPKKHEHPDSEPDDSEQDNSEPDDSFPHFGEKGISPVSKSNPYSDSDSETNIKECLKCFNLEDDDPASKLNKEGYCSECACALSEQE